VISPVLVAFSKREVHRRSWARPLREGSRPSLAEACGRSGGDCGCYGYRKNQPGAAGLLAGHRGGGGGKTEAADGFFESRASRFGLRRPAQLVQRNFGGIPWRSANWRKRFGGRRRPPAPPAHTGWRDGPMSGAQGSGAPGNCGLLEALRRNAGSGQFISPLIAWYRPAHSWTRAGGAMRPGLAVGSPPAGSRSRSGGKSKTCWVLKSRRAGAQRRVCAWERGRRSPFSDGGREEVGGKALRREAGDQLFQSRVAGAHTSAAGERGLCRIPLNSIVDHAHRA